MRSTLATLWNDLLVALGYRQGHAAGEADQRTADVEKNDEAAQVERRAEDAVPAAGDDAAMDQRLRTGPGL